MTLPATKADFSKIKEVVATWQNIRQVMRSGEEGSLVPVAIPKDRRGFGWLTGIAFGIYFIGVALFAGGILAAAAIA
ncbi:MAG: SPFH domain-containing protein, partial [Chloroflexaceae bacterium]|nr:SPFH domain-containing protein [Chloroflexaceae bacterium]